MKTLITANGYVAARYLTELQALEWPIHLLTSQDPDTLQGLSLAGIYPRQSTSLPEAIQGLGIDLVIVTNHPHRRGEVLSALEETPSPLSVIVEKPLACTSLEADRWMRLRAKGHRIWVNYPLQHESFGKMGMGESDRELFIDYRTLPRCRELPGNPIRDLWPHVACILRKIKAQGLVKGLRKTSDHSYNLHIYNPWRVTITLAWEDSLEATSRQFLQMACTPAVRGNSRTKNIYQVNLASRTVGYTSKIETEQNPRAEVVFSACEMQTLKPHLPVQILLGLVRDSKLDKSLAWGIHDAKVIELLERKAGLK